MTAQCCLPEPLQAPLTCYSLHLGAPGLDAALGQALLGDDAANVIGKDERGLQDGEGLRVGAGGRLVDYYVQGSAVILYSGHLHVLKRSRMQIVKEKVSFSKLQIKY